jgi:hypothetical protein
MWRRLLRIAHPDSAGDDALFVWVEWGYPECVHDEDEQAFYSRASGELVLSRDYFNLPAMGRAERGELQRRVGEG